MKVALNGQTVYMTSQMNHVIPWRYRQRKPEHPGLFLERCYLRPLKISQSELARTLGISRRRVNEIVNGQRAITADTALRLAERFHTTPMFWLEKQQLWELYEVSRAH
jgi:addiction module HigA family antidote